MVALKRARGLCFVKDACACADELFVELSLVIAAVPALSVQRLERRSALRDAVERICMPRNLSTLVEQLHGAERTLGLGWAVRRVV